MPKYTVLGATGNIGQCILRVLAEQQQSSSSSGQDAITINAYARSKPKFLNLFPSILDDSKVTLFDGSLTADVLSASMEDAHAVFMAVAPAENTPGLSLSQDFARVVVDALESLRARLGAKYTPPRLIMLSSATVSDVLWRGEGMPSLVHSALHSTLSHIYNDLELAEKFLRGYDHGSNGRLFEVTFAKPGGLIDHPAQGHVLSEEASKTFTSFVDVAGGMIELAGRPDGESWKWAGKDVSVNSAVPGGARLGLWTGFELGRGLVSGLFLLVKGMIPGLRG